MDQAKAVVEDMRSASGFHKREPSNELEKGKCLSSLNDAAEPECWESFETGLEAARGRSEDL